MDKNKSHKTKQKRNIKKSSRASWRTAASACETKLNVESQIYYRSLLVPHNVNFLDAMLNVSYCTTISTLPGQKQQQQQQQLQHNKAKQEQQK